jgi:single-stranded-DNA-specific exonuclease
MQKIWKVINDCRGLSNLEIIENIFNSRNIENIDRFMNPTKDDLIPYEELCNIQFARDIVINGLNNNKRFTIHFDTDTDGCTAGAIIYRYLNNYTENIDWTINIGKAHGLNGQDLSKYKNTDILIIVDSIDSDPIVYEELYNMGIEMIILDHHDIPYENYALEYVTLVF